MNTQDVLVASMNGLAAKIDAIANALYDFDVTQEPPQQLREALSSLRDASYKLHGVTNYILEG